MSPTSTNPGDLTGDGPGAASPALPTGQRHLQTPGVREAKASCLTPDSRQALSHHWKPSQDTAATVNKVNPYQDLNSAISCFDSKSSDLGKQRRRPIQLMRRSLLFLLAQGSAMSSKLSKTLKKKQ